MENKKENKGKMTLDRLARMLGDSTHETQAKIDEIVSKMDTLTSKDEMNLRFDSVDRRLDRINEKLDGQQELSNNHEKDILNLKHKVGVLGRKQA